MDLPTSQTAMSEPRQTAFIMPGHDPGILALPAKKIARPSRAMMRQLMHRA
jgi:hypothetical protein